MRFLSQSLLIFISLLLAFVWNKTPLSNYTTPAIALLVIAYILTNLHHSTKEIIGACMLTLVILLLIFSTNSLSSPFFFLLYFLSFGIAFVFEPEVVFSFAIGILILFFPDTLKNDSLGNFIKLSSFILISPLAFFFAKEYRKKDHDDFQIDAMEERTQEAADVISKDVEKVLKDEKQALRKEDVEKLNEILEQTEDLRLEAK